MREFDISEAASVYWETDNDGFTAYVVTIHRDGWRMRTDAPADVFGIAARRRWAVNESYRQAALIRAAHRD